jgi:hypothetical protein
MVEVVVEVTVVVTLLVTLLVTVVVFEVVVEVDVEVVVPVPALSVKLTEAVFFPSVADTVYVPGAAVGATKKSVNAPFPLVPALVWVAPTNPTVTTLTGAKPLPVKRIAVPGGPLVGLRTSTAWAAKTGVAGMEKRIKHAATDANNAARPEMDRVPVTRRPRSNNEVLTSLRNTRT